MPILVWIATVACMWEIAGAGIHPRPATSPARRRPSRGSRARRDEPPAIS